MNGAGIVLLLLTTLLLWVGSAAFVWRHLPGRPSERLAWSLAGVMALVVVETQALGLFWSGYSRTALLLLDLILGGGLLVLCARGLHALRSDIGHLWGALCGRCGLPLLAVGPAAAIALWLAALVYTYRVPVPGIDAVTYHLPIAVSIVQEGNLGQFETRCGHVNEFPRNGQMVFARVFAYTGNELAVRPVQWMAGLAAVLALIGWMRHLGVSRSIAGTLAPMLLAVPAVLHQVLILWGSIDLTFHALLIGAWGAAAWMPAERGPAFRRTLVAIALGSLAVGTKSTGVLIGGLASFVAIGRLVWLHRGAARPLLARVIPAGALLLLLLGSSQYLQNWRWHGNPLAPIAVTVAGNKVFPGSFDSVHQLIETKTHAGTSRNHKALWRSWRVLFSGGEGARDSRLGGWGIAWLFALFPGLLAGIALAAHRGQGHVVATGAILLTLLILVPGSWWSRFSILSFAAALAYLAHALSAVSSGRMRATLVVYTSVLSMAAGAESFSAAVRNNTPADLDFPAGEFRHSLDTFRMKQGWEWKEDRDIYLWCRDNLPPDSTVVYFFPYWLGTYHYFFLRRDTANRVHGLGGAKSAEEFLQLLEDRQATYYVVEQGSNFTPWGPLCGREVFRAGRFAIYKRAGE
jgi:hypothetical protein